MNSDSDNGSAENFKNYNTPKTDIKHLSAANDFECSNKSSQSSSSPKFIVKNKIENNSPFNIYSPKNEPIFRNMNNPSVTSISMSIDSTTTCSTINLESKFESFKFYAPGKLLKAKPRLRLIQMYIHDDDIKFIFEVISDVKWFIVKDSKSLKGLTKKISSDIMTSLEPDKIRVRKELVEIYVNSSISQDVDQMQFFILTGVVFDYATRTEYILVKDKEWLIVRGKILNRNLVLYSGQIVYKIIYLEDSYLRILNETMFEIESRGSLQCFNTFSIAERDSWINYIKGQ